MTRENPETQFFSIQAELSLSCQSNLNSQQPRLASTPDQKMSHHYHHHSRKPSPSCSLFFHIIRILYFVESGKQRQQTHVSPSPSTSIIKVPKALGQLQFCMYLYRAEQVHSQVAHVQLAFTRLLRFSWGIPVPEKKLHFCSF